MIEALKDFVNAVSSPVTIFTASAILFALFVSFPKTFTSLPVSLSLAGLGLAFFGVGLTDKHFRTIVSTPDNVPIVGMLFIFFYFTWFAMRKAVLNDERIEASKPPQEKEESEQKVMVFPYLIYIEFVAALFYSIMLVVWALYLKAPLEESANPSISPNPSKAPWYFLGLQEMLVYFDPWIAGVLFPTLIIIGLCAIPYIDSQPKVGVGYYSFKQRRHEIIGFLFGFWVLWVLMIIMGTFLRGPNWNFFGPFEVWDVHKLVPLVNVNLSEFIFIKWLGMGLPKFWLLREFPGILIVAAYFAVPPVLLKKPLKSFYDSAGAVRYYIYLFLILAMIALPIKMYLRWAFNLKYIVGIPEFFFNI